MTSLKQAPEFLFQMLNFVIPSIKSYGLMSGDSLKTFEMYARMIAETEYFVTIIDIIINYVEDVAKTEFGVRFSKMIPMLMKAQDMNQVLAAPFSYFENHRYYYFKTPGQDFLSEEWVLLNQSSLFLSRWQCV